jgi:hypothetical protein
MSTIDEQAIKAELVRRGLWRDEPESAVTTTVVNPDAEMAEFERQLVEAIRRDQQAEVEALGDPVPEPEPIEPDEEQLKLDHRAEFVAQMRGRVAALKMPAVPLGEIKVIQGE